MNIQFALRRVRDARENLEALAAVRTNAHAVWRQKLVEAQAATAAAESCDLDAAVELANARSTAAIVADAAKRGADAADQKHAKAVSELADAEDAARQSAFAIIAVEAEHLASQISSDEAALKAKRRKLASIRDIPGFEPSTAIAVAVGDGMHMPLNAMPIPGDLDVPVNRMTKTGILVDASTDDGQHWRDRVAELLSSNREDEDRSAA